MERLKFLSTDSLAVKKRGVKYGKYIDASKEIAVPIKEHIKSSKSGVAILKIDDVADIMNMKGRSASALYRGLKFALWSEDIVVETSTHTNGDKVLVFKNRTDEDKLPEGLAKILE